MHRSRLPKSARESARSRPRQASETSPGAFAIEIALPLGGLEVARDLLGQEGSGREFVQGLFDDPEALVYLLHPDPIPGQGVAGRLHGDVEIEPGIDRIGFVFPDVVFDARPAQHGPRGAVFPAKLGGDDADALDALPEDDVVRHQAAIQDKPLPHPGEEGPAAGDEPVVDVVAHPAEAEIAVGQTRPGDRFQKIQDNLPIVEGIQQRRQPPEVDDEGAEPQQVARDPAELRRDHPDVLGTLRHRNAGQPFDGTGVSEIVDHGPGIVDPSGVGKILDIRPVFGHLFLHPVAVADDRLRMHDVLPVHGELEAQYPVGGRMLGPHVDDKSFSLDGQGIEAHAEKSFRRG
jgi:hypothetical protein